MHNLALIDKMSTVHTSSIRGFLPSHFPLHLWTLISVLHNYLLLLAILPPTSELFWKTIKLSLGNNKSMNWNESCVIITGDNISAVQFWLSFRLASLFPRAACNRKNKWKPSRRCYMPTGVHGDCLVGQLPPHSAERAGSWYWWKCRNVWIDYISDRISSEAVDLLTRFSLS